MITKEEAEALAAVIQSADPDDHVTGYFAQLAQRLRDDGVELPRVTIEWRNLKRVVEATTSQGSLPSLPNVLLLIAKKLTFQRPKTEPLTILNNLSGVLKPGRLTLLLAPPSTGKTTFLRALAGRLPAKTYTGDITYNGHHANEFSPERTIAYVAQFDTHIPNLTARETVQFSYDIQHCPSGSAFQYAPPRARVKPGADTPLCSVATPGDAPQLKGISAADLADLTRAAFDGPGRVDTLMGLFGLARAKDTNVGNRMFRGISGGERKRLSTVEMLAGPQRVLVLDEISTGLDAATLFDVVRWLRAMTHHLEMTVIVSLLQPPPETFALFDDLMLMNEGTVVFHGPLQAALPHVQSLGFDIPPRKDLPSFLQEVTTVRGQIIYANPALRAARGAPLSLAAIDDIELSQRDLLVPLSEMAALAAPAAPATAPAKAGAPAGSALVPLTERYPLPVLAMLRLVLARQAKLFVRDVTLVRARIAQCVIMGLLIGGLWFQRDNTLDDARTVLSAIFMIVMFLGFGGLPQLAVALQNRSVWFKHREAQEYTAAAYAWSMSLVQMPMSLIEALVFSSIIYFMVGFTTDSPRYFFIFCLVLASASLAITSIFRMVGAFFASPAIANAAAGFLLLMLVVNSGFVIVRTAIEPWVIWFYYLSPFAYSIRALAINEMTSPRWAAPAPFSGRSIGETALETFDFFTEEKWIWIGVAFNLGFFVVTTQISALALARMAAPQRTAIIKRKEDVKMALEAARKVREDTQAALGQSQGGRATSNGARTAPEAPAKTPLAAVGPPNSRRSIDGGGHNALEVGSTLKFTSISVCWKAINYYVPVPKGLTGAAALNIMDAGAAEDVRGKKRLLHDITGHAEPGVLTALMGGSGAGKTTLMDVLAGRKTQGVLHGELTVNGHPKVQETWARVVGYVEQTDVHSGGLTVEESLQFSAGLRLTEDVPQATREAYVLEVMLVTNLLDIKGNLVGEPGESGLSVEQRRRLSIAVELVANPSVIFLDEPTSGLDAQSAAAVMAATRNVTENNRTVMVTIHQPSIEIFESFDRLVLLGMGGELIYFGDVGEHSCDLVRYFEGISGVPDLPPGYNPATWMLEVSGGGAKMHIDAVDVDFAAQYHASALCAEAEQRVDAIVAERAAATAPLALATRYAVPFVQQTKMAVWKEAIVYWRYPNYTVGRLVVATITALLCGITWWGEGSLPDGPASIANINNLVGSLYASLAFMGMTNLIGGLPAFLSERQVMYRERAASMYAVLPFGIATGVVELPYLIAQALIFVPISYFMIGFRAEAGPLLLYIVIFTESIALYTFMGQFFTYLTPTAPVATVLGGLCHFLWTLFSGFLITRPAMARGFVWLYYFSGTAYVLYGNAAAQLGNEDRKAIIPGQKYAPCSAENLEACPTVGQYMEDFFGFEYEFRWWCVLILLVFIMFFRVAAMVVLKLVNHQKR